jgi:hypothetical protein
MRIVLTEGQYKRLVGRKLHEQEITSDQKVTTFFRIYDEISYVNKIIKETLGIDRDLHIKSADEEKNVFVVRGDDYSEDEKNKIKSTLEGLTWMEFTVKLSDPDIEIKFKDPKILSKVDSTDKVGKNVVVSSGLEQSIKDKVKKFCSTKSRNGCLDWRKELVKVGTYNNTTGGGRTESCECENCEPLFLVGCGDHPYGDDAYLSSKAAKSFKKMEQAYGKKIPIESAYRDFFHQSVLPSTEAPQAKPGSSKHGLGEALDISNADARKWMKKNGETYGWYWFGAADENHFDYKG